MVSFPVQYKKTNHQGSTLVEMLLALFCVMVEFAWAMSDLTPVSTQCDMEIPMIEWANQVLHNEVIYETQLVSRLIDHFEMKYTSQCEIK